MTLLTMTLLPMERHCSSRPRSRRATVRCMAHCTGAPYRLSCIVQGAAKCTTSSTILLLSTQAHGMLLYGLPSYHTPTRHRRPASSGGACAKGTLRCRCRSGGRWPSEQAKGLGGKAPVNSGGEHLSNSILPLSRTLVSRVFDSRVRMRSIFYGIRARPRARTAVAWRGPAPAAPPLALNVPLYKPPPLPVTCNKPYHFAR